MLCIYNSFRTSLVSLLQFKALYLQQVHFMGICIYLYIHIYVIVIEANTTYIVPLEVQKQIFAHKLK